MPDSNIIHKHNYQLFKPWHLFALLIPSTVFTLILVYSSLSSVNNMPKSTEVSAENVDIKKVQQLKIEDKIITAEIADTDNARRIGLSKHISLPEDQGMLFIFDQDNAHPVRFWMVGMNFGLDLIWIDDGYIVQIDKNIPPQPQDTPVFDIDYYPSNQPIDYVLEVNAGFSDANNIQVGSSVDFIFND